MDRQLLERMVGAAVLIIALVIIAPAVLDGPDDKSPAPVPAAPTGEAVRTVTIRPDRPAAEPPVARTAGDAAPAAAEVPAPEPEAPAAPATNESAAPAVVPAKPPPPPAKPPPAPAPKPKPQPSPQRSGWAVQLGSFANRDNASRLAGEVSARGYDTYLLPLERDGRTLYRVRVGPRPSRAAAQELAGELAKAGYRGQVTAEGPAS